MTENMNNIRKVTEVTKNGASVIKSWAPERQDFVYQIQRRGDIRAVEISEEDYYALVRNVEITPASASAPAPAAKETSDGSSADYYKLPASALQLQDLIAHKNMNAQIGEIFRACYRYGQVAHSPQIRDLKKMRFYIDAEIARLEGSNIAIPS